MLKINMEVRHGILFIRLNGNLNKNTSIKIENYVMPMLEKYKIKYISYSFKNLHSIDKDGIKIISKTLKMINRINGIAYICDINNKILNECRNLNALKVKNELNVMECLQI